MALPAKKANFTLADKKADASAWFTQLRDEICDAFEAIEDEVAPRKGLIGKFERKTWDREGGGGGEISLMRGQVFEKVGVNISTVHGTFSDDFKSQVRGAEEDGAFWASGISLVAHMRNPHIPAAHLNTRFVCTSQNWFGGGGDLTPVLPDVGATTDFHAALRAVCDKHDPEYYDKYKPKEVVEQEFFGRKMQIISKNTILILRLQTHHQQ